MALRLLEVMRDMDLPMEILEDEDPTQTIPRRFGLSDVVERQIRTYREDVRRRVRLTDDEIRGLFRFVIRRPDGPEVFRAVGRQLAAEERAPRWVRRLPGGLRYRAMRRHARKRLKRLFGRPIGGFGRGAFVIEGRSLLFFEADPGGDACHLLSGFTEEFLSRALGGSARVEHTLCQGLGHDLCRWEPELVQDAASVTDSPPEVRIDDGDEGPIPT
ncbi:MAG: hypothetical protein ACPHWZ_05525 [Longimicrobiales bacterium]